MNRFRYLHFAMLMIFSLTAIAEEYSFVVWTKSGEQINFPLSEKPKLTHNDNNFIVTTPTTTVEYSKADINKFTLLIPDGVDNIENSNGYNLSPAQRFSGNFLLHSFQISEYPK